MKFPVGSLVYIDRNSEKLEAAVVALYPYRIEQYMCIVVKKDKHTGRFSALPNHEVLYLTEDKILEISNIYSLDSNQVSSILNSKGIDSHILWEKMEQEVKKISKS